MIATCSIMGDVMATKIISSHTNIAWITVMVLMSLRKLTSTQPRRWMMLKVIACGMGCRRDSIFEGTAGIRWRSIKRCVLQGLEDARWSAFINIFLGFYNLINAYKKIKALILQIIVTFGFSTLPTHLTESNSWTLGEIDLGR